MNSDTGSPGARILGLGHYRPSKVLTNDDIAALVDTNDAWIRDRVGVVTRHIAADDESVVDMAVAAAGKAMAAAGVEPDSIDLVVTATCTLEASLPGASATIATRLGIPGPGAFDLNAACAGFCYGLTVANDAIRCGSAQRVLLIGAEKLSAWVDWTDRSTCIIFGDGAGAAVIGPSETTGIGPVVWGSDGTKAAAITIPKRGAAMQMEGQAVFRWATTTMGKVALEACRRAGVAPEDIAVVIPHQANLRIVDAIVRQLGATNAIIARDIVDSGNTSAASIPLALSRLVERGEARTGDEALVLAFGAGLTFAGQVVTCP
ncbi:MAG: ketoacyl-ACP synthase III [Actinomycetota bacterium]|nr:ketoacyl-ACP synthase III [Actinomycetota bacterium]